MSAFVVSDNHIHALLTFAEMKRMQGRLSYIANEGALTPLTWTDIGRILLAENERSVSHRYDTGPGAKPEDIGYRFKAHQPLFMMQHPKMLATILKSCDCFDYQACETDDYHETIAAKIIRHIRKEAIRALPGYDDAPWGIDG